MNVETTGYFGPESISWLLYREPIVILGGPRALLLQIAHPAVADGVTRYSNFKKDALGRGIRTFRAMAMIYFGTAHQAEATASRLQRVHQGIRGQYPNPAPQAYRATDPALMAWVLATLTDTTLLIFEKFKLKALPTGWQEKFYDESCTAARLLGIDAGYYPPDLSTFRKYFDEILHSDLLGSTPECQQLTQAILYHRFTPTYLAKVLAAGWMPEPLSQRLGINIPRAPQKVERLFPVLSTVYRLCPPPFRYSPAYFQAHARLAKAAGNPEPLLGRWYNWLSQKWSIPLGI